MSILVAFALALLRFTGYFLEPQLDDHEIHAVAGEPVRVTATLDPDRPLRIVTWNIERGMRFDRIAETLETLEADVVLLQEVDRFCGRSDYRDVARELGVALNMNWIAAGEFQEIGEGKRGAACVSGQAILSRQPIVDAATIRFEAQASMKWRLNPAQPRRGGRIALRASTGGITFYDLHLESGGNEDLREEQLRELAVDAHPRTVPVIVGGDFNNEGGTTASQMFATLRACNFVNTMAPGGDGARRPIDWLFARGISGTATPVPAADASDHDPVLLLTSVQRRN